MLPQLLNPKPFGRKADTISTTTLRPMYIRFQEASWLDPHSGSVLYISHETPITSSIQERTRERFNVNILRNINISLVNNDNIQNIYLVNNDNI